MHIKSNYHGFLTGAKNKNKKRQKFCVFGFCSSKNGPQQKTEARFSFFFAFGGAKNENAKFLAFFVFVFSPVRSGLITTKNFEAKNVIVEGI